MVPSPEGPHYSSSFPHPPPEDDDKGENTHTQHRKHQEQLREQSLCDYCGESAALLYCRADSAKLCFACDRHVHAANALFSKHLRSHLCDVCDSGPASIRCYAHDLFLCHNCDWDCHDDRRSPGARHDRRPLDGFSGCPSAFEFGSALGFEEKVLLEDDDGGDAAAMADGFLDSWVWETPPVVSLDDLIVPTTNDSGRNFLALGVPPPPRHRSVACGKHKDEILHQLRDLVKTEANLNNDGELEPILEFQSLLSNQNIEIQNLVAKVDRDPVPISATGSELHLHVSKNLGGIEQKTCNSMEDVVWKIGYWSRSQVSGLHWQGNHRDETIQVPSFGGLSESTIEETAKVELPSNIQSDETKANDNKIEMPHRIIREAAAVHPKSIYELAAPDRDTVISRYKEKKRARRYDKHIRYESRKARADSRMRIRGRFAKVVNTEQSINSAGPTPQV
ncbi:hypothetical protein ACLOJK_018018 [Asimina triloba]